MFEMFDSLQMYEILLIWGLTIFAAIKFVSALKGVSRRSFARKFARLQREVALLSDCVKHLESTKQRPFISELKPSIAPAAVPARLQ
jgi:hypothetical protein